MRYGVGILLSLIFSTPAWAERVVDVRMAFGYKDSRPARFVGDRYERLFLIQKITRGCDEKEKVVCGFVRDAEDGNLFEKRFSDGAESVRLVLRLTASSAGPDDLENRRNPYQKHLSHVSRNNFLNGIRAADAVYYIGHSRDGGGPSFVPPRLNRTQHVAYDWYLRRRPGLKNLLRALKDRKHQTSGPALKLGLLSCASTKLFAKKIRQASAKTEALTVPELLYYSEALSKALSELALLAGPATSGYALKN